MLRGILFPDEVEQVVEYPLLRVSRRAMATRFEIAMPNGTPNADGRTPSPEEIL